MNPESFGNPISELLGPLSRRCGKVLGAFGGILLSWADKYVYFDEINQARWKANFEKFEKSLAEYDEEEIRPALPEIAVPVLERLGYITNEDISDAFIKLLTRASTVNGLQYAHPGFIHIIDRLSSDEAKILKNVIQHAYILVLLVWLNDNPEGKMVLASRVYLLLETKEKELSLDFPDNLHLYIDNLSSLGIIELANQNTISNSRINLLREMWSRRIGVPEDQLAGPQITDSNGMVHTPWYSAIKLSSFGVKFASACLADGEYLQDLYDIKYGKNE